MPVVTLQQITDFKRDGYLLVDDTISADDLRLFLHHKQPQPRKPAITSTVDVIVATFAIA